MKVSKRVSPGGNSGTLEETVKVRQGVTMLADWLELRITTIKEALY